MDDNTYKLRVWAGIVLSLLLLQLILGLAAMKLLTLSVSNPWLASHPEGLLLAHAIAGLLLFALSLHMFALSRRTGSAKRQADVGLAGTALATITGVLFVQTGGTTNAFSDLMALGIFIAIIGYGWMMLAASPLAQSPGDED